MSFKIIVTTSVARPCFTTQHQTWMTDFWRACLSAIAEFLVCRYAMSGNGIHVRLDFITEQTRNSAIADKHARRVYRSVNVTKHSTIPYVTYFPIVHSNFVFKTRRFYDIRLQKCRDLEIRVRGHSRSLKGYHCIDLVWFPISVR